MQGRPPAIPRHPTDMRAGAWSGTLKRTFVGFVDDHLLYWAAALTFFAILSLFPALLALVALLGVVGSEAIDPLIENVSRLAPGPAREIALDALNALRNSERAGTALLVAVAVALWTASAYVGAFIPAANIVWDVEDARP